jgi:hypothetical protein
MDKLITIVGARAEAMKGIPTVMVRRTRGSRPAGNAGDAASVAAAMRPDLEGIVIPLAKWIRWRCIMSHNWGPCYIVPSEIFKTYSGNVLLREEFDEDLLHKQLEELGFVGPVVRIADPWYYRKRNTNTWIKIGESEDRHKHFPVMWDTTNSENGKYEVMGLMHVFVRKEGNDITIAGQNVVEVTVENPSAISA